MIEHRDDGRLALFIGAGEGDAGAEMALDLQRGGKAAEERTRQSLQEQEMPFALAGQTAAGTAGDDVAAHRP